MDTEPPDDRLTLTELAEMYVGNRLTVINEFCGDFETKYRELRTFITEQINPLLIRHGADPLDVNMVADLDADDIVEPYSIVRD